ncbi:MAG: redox-regulated ATPase YchF [Anaerolineae bacterium]|nr:redox-regulated ATPase YchF [Anaerolineae bacterium]
MQLGLIGLPMSGKTTAFNALTGANRPTSIAVPGKLDVQLAVVDVPDPRLDALTAMFNPRKKVHAKITFADIGGLAKGISEGGLSGQFRNEIAQMDGFVQVVRVFKDENVPHPEGAIDPQRDIDILDSEFLLTDLVTVENRISRLKEEMSKGKERDKNARELELFEQMRETLETEKPLRSLGLPYEEQRALRGYGFLSIKPRLILLNFGDERPDLASLVSLVEPTTVLGIQARIEAEIAQLDAEEAVLFLEEYQISEPVRERVIREAYNLLHVQTFFTVGEDETRAWPHTIGATAQEAAGVIHTDLQRGFIRAEIVPSDVLLELGGMAEVKQAGKLRLEGKEYIMHDGDVMNVRFNI